MKFCPECRSEFQDWAQVCNDCQVPLVDKLPKIKTPAHGKDHDEIVTIASFYHPPEAQLLSAKLKSAGIPSFVADENLVNWVYSYAIGGVRLQVFKSDVSRARKVLGLKGQEAR